MLMRFDKDDAVLLSQRISELVTIGEPPVQVLHPLMALADSRPEHLVASYTDADPAIWQLVALDGHMLTYVRAAASPSHGWTRKAEEFHNKQVDASVTAWSRPLSCVTGLVARETITYPERGGEFDLTGPVYVTWGVEFADGSEIVLPALSNDEPVTSLAMAIRDGMSANDVLPGLA